MSQIDHIGIAVKSIDEAASFYTDVLGLKITGRETVPGLNIAFIQAGGAKVELLEPAGPDSAVAKFIETRGEGIQHIAFEVKDIEAALAKAKAAGYRLIDEKPRPGAGGHRVAFLHPKSLHGVLVEFCQRSEG